MDDLVDKTHKLILEFIRTIKVNFDLDFHHDSIHNRLYIYPSGKDNQREVIIIEHSEHANTIYISGHGEKTNIDYVCKPDLDEINYCLLTVVSKFREDNSWTWKMPCETRYENKDLN